MDELSKHIIPGFNTNSEISKWVSTLDDGTKSFIKKAALTMQQLEYLKWGTSDREKVLKEIEKIRKGK